MIFSNASTRFLAASGEDPILFSINAALIKVKRVYPLFLQLKNIGCNYFLFLCRKKLSNASIMSPETLYTMPHAIKSRFRTPSNSLPLGQLYEQFE